jgi:hypothetical protein
MDKSARDLHALLSNEALQWASSDGRVAKRVRKFRDEVEVLSGELGRERDRLNGLEWTALYSQWLRAEGIASCFVQTPDRDPLLGSVTRARRLALNLWLAIATNAIPHTTGRVQRRYMAEVNQVKRMLRQ